MREMPRSTLLSSREVSSGCADGCPAGLVCGNDDLCVPPPPVGSCENPEVFNPFGSNLGDCPGPICFYSGDTTANVSNTAGSCGEPGSPDHVFSISVDEFICPAGGCQICLSTAPVYCDGRFLSGPCIGSLSDDGWPNGALPTTFDTIIRVHEQSCLGAEVACEVNTYPGIRGSAVTVDMMPNQNYFVVVDGQSPGLFGQFNLVVSYGACP